ncbi:MAG: right-handed parallel beta-helix repeat-containing protein, partial [Thermoplasmata archaeon]
MKNKLISMELACLLIIWGFIGLMDICNENVSAYTPHNPIYIEGDDDFSDGDDDGVINPSSAGTEGDPYIIAGWEINASTANGIEIRNTTVYFIIRDCYVHGSESPYLGIWFFNVTNGRIEDSNILKNWLGIDLNQSSSSTIYNNSILNNDYGINISGSRNIIFNNSICFNDFTGLYLSGSNNTISHNNVSNNGDGIYLNLSSYTKIFKNSFYSNNGSIMSPGYGIILSSSLCNKISYNNISGNGNHIDISGCGIWLISSGNNTIHHNKIRSNDIYGIYLSSSSNNIIFNNNIQDHCGEGMRLQLSSNNKIFNNDFFENVIALVIHKGSYNTVSDNWFNWRFHGICLSYSSYNTIYNNFIFNTVNGIYLSASHNNTISHNNIFTSIIDGIHLWSSSNNTISNNLIQWSDDIGIFLWSNSNTNKIICNNVSNNQECGINISGSINNYIYHNDIIDNAIQAYDDTNNSNQWDNGYPCGGNYWSDFDEPSEGAYDDYQGPYQNVVGSDGIVDNGTGVGGGKNPYIIDADSKDNYPLLYPLMS